jgi:hypothetical protein
MVMESMWTKTPSSLDEEEERWGEDETSLPDQTFSRSVLGCESPSWRMRLPLLLRMGMTVSLGPCATI